MSLIQAGHGSELRHVGVKLVRFLQHLPMKRIPFARGEVPSPVFCPSQLSEKPLG